MFSKIFSKEPVIDEGTKSWLFDCAEWSITQFNSQYFVKNTELILPTNEYFPGRVSSIEEMARNIFGKTLKYCGMEEWPVTLTPVQLWSKQQFPTISYEGEIRGSGNPIQLIGDSQSFQVVYNPAQVNQPQDMIATYVQQLASILVLSRKVLPPGGEKFLPQASEVLSCFMGFGVVFANTAYQFKGGCGSCYNPSANREVSVQENDMLYALAIFTVLKDEQVRKVAQQLKKHLRSQFKKMVSDVRTTLKAQPESSLHLVSVSN